MIPQHHYDAVAKEIQKKQIMPGLWTRAVAEAKGQLEVAKSLYIMLRCKELMAAEQNQRRANNAKQTENQEPTQWNSERSTQAEPSWSNVLITLVVLFLVIGGLVAIANMLK